MAGFGVRPGSLTYRGIPMNSVHATAMSRTGLSRPVRLAVEIGLIVPGETRVFDYGCGRGDDVARLCRRGVTASGWDPTSLPTEPLVEADVVNLGYVINVIADPSERAEALKRAWQLSRKALVVAARLTPDMPDRLRPSGDGFVTTRGTFQKFYTQQELRSWVDETLDVEAVAVAPGVFVVFREEADALQWFASRRRRTSRAPAVGVRDDLYDSNSDLLGKLQDFFVERGRLPVTGEVNFEEDIIDHLGSFPRAWQVIRHVTDTDAWDDIVEQRRSESTVWLALARLRKRPRFGQLPQHLQADVRAFFGTYSKACAEGDALLHGAGDLTAIRATATAAPVGKRTPSDLYLHVEALNTLPPLLQVYEGCARFVSGNVDGANLVKLAWDKPKVSYLAYPEFDTDPHPALAAAAVIRLDELSVEFRGYRHRTNPPILHRKETFVPNDYPGRDKFARLTAQEQRAGLLSDPRIGTRDGWQAALVAARKQLRGHRLIAMKEPLP